VVKRFVRRELAGDVVGRYARVAWRRVTALDANLGGVVITWHDRIHLFTWFLRLALGSEVRHYYDMVDGKDHGVLGRVVTR